LLRGFQDKLHRAANLNVEPDLDDGIVLNIAPLDGLLAWKETRKYWDGRSKANTSGLDRHAGGREGLGRIDVKGGITMATVTIQEAQANLSDLIHQLAPG
jgi:hypothetical protein